MYEDFEKIFKPITEQQQKSSKEIVSKFTTLQEAIENTPAQQALPWVPELEGQAEALPAPDYGPMNVGPLATKYLAKWTDKDLGDKTYGPKGITGNLKLGNANFETDGNAMIINEKRYEGTKGLWELVMKKNPENYTTDDLKTYSKLIIPTNVMSRSGDIRYPRASASNKWKNIMSNIWESVNAQQHRKVEFQKQEGKKELKRVMKEVQIIRAKSNPGTSEQGFLPSDPNALFERLELLKLRNKQETLVFETKL